MKKSIIALAVAGAMAVPMVAQADATIFGEYVGYISDSDNGDLELVNDTVAVGVKGTVDNGIDGLETGFEFNFEVNGAGTLEQDVAYSYLSGDFGTVTIGLHDSVADIAEDVGEQGGEFANIGDTGAGLSYMTPDMGGFWAGVYVADLDGDDTTDTIGVSAIALGFEAGDFSVALGHEAYETADSDITALVATYSADAFSAFVNIEDGEATNSDYWSIGGAFAATDAVEVYAEYGDNEADNTDQFLIGASYAMGDAYVALEYNMIEDAGVDSDTVLFAYGLEF